MQGKDFNVATNFTIFRCSKNVNYRNLISRQRQPTHSNKCETLRNISELNLILTVGKNLLFLRDALLQLCLEFYRYPYNLAELIALLLPNDQCETVGTFPSQQSGTKISLVINPNSLANINSWTRA